MVLSALARPCPAFLFALPAAHTCGRDCSSQNASSGVIAVASSARAVASFRRRSASSQLRPRRPYARLTSMPTLTKLALRSAALASPFANALRPA